MSGTYPNRIRADQGYEVSGNQRSRRAITPRCPVMRSRVFFHQDAGTE